MSRQADSCVNLLVETSDRALLAGLIAGDVQAFDVAYDRHRARIHAFLLRLSGRRDVAEDLLQETWLRLARAAPRLSPDVPLLPWLLTVARNLHVSWWRWQVLDARRLRELGLLPPPRSNVDDAAAAGEALGRLEAALAALPASHREVLLLSGVGGLEPAGVAQVLGLTPEAARQRLSRARRALADRLGLSPTEETP